MKFLVLRNLYLVLVLTYAIPSIASTNKNHFDKKNNLSKPLTIELTHINNQSKLNNTNKNNF